MKRKPARPVSSAHRIVSYRARMRAAGMKSVQLWLPDSRAPGFAEKCRAQSLAIARHEPAGDEALEFIEGTYAWPET